MEKKKEKKSAEEAKKKQKKKSIDGDLCRQKRSWKTQRAVCETWIPYKMFDL
jgi:beta-lactamase superfamily II metal-dependent hydrolase